MLVVVHHRYVALFFKAALDFEAFGRFYVFKVYASEGWGERFDDFDELGRVFFIDFYIEAVDSSEYLEQQGFPFHYRFPCACTYVAEAEHCCAVGDYGHEVRLIGVGPHFHGVVFYFEAGVGHSRGIGQRQVGGRVIRLGGYYFEFSGTRVAMVGQRHFSE